MNLMLKNFGNFWKEADWSIIHFFHIIILLEDWGHINIFYAIWEAAALNKHQKDQLDKKNLSSLDLNIFGETAFVVSPS